MLPDGSLGDADDPGNLSIMSPSECTARHRRKTEYWTFTCLECYSTATKPARQIRHNLKRGCAGPFCSRSCAGRWNMSEMAGKWRRQRTIPPHGSALRYRNGCRCEACTATHKIRARRDRETIEPPPRTLPTRRHLIAVVEGEPTDHLLERPTTP